MKFTTEIEGDVLGIGADVTKEFSLSRSPDVNAALIRWMQDVIKLTIEGIERVDAVFAGGGDVTADAAEVHECLETAEGAGDFLAQLHHP